MAIRVELYTSEGIVTGTLPRSGHLRDVLETVGALEVERASWRPWVDPGSSRPAGELRLPVDDILAATGDDAPPIPVHASWHAIRLVVGPLVLTGELPTLPGYDPGRALARPTGEFVLLRDVGIVPPDEAPVLGPLPAVHVNRYAVERVAADIMLGFYFPGAAMEDPAALGA